MQTRDLFDLSGKTALVTGGGRGIGKALALGLAEMGVAELTLPLYESLLTDDQKEEVAAYVTTAKALRSRS